MKEEKFLGSVMTVPPNTSTASGERMATSDVLPNNGGTAPLPPDAFGGKEEGGSMKDEDGGQVMTEGCAVTNEGKEQGGQARVCAVEAPLASAAFRGMCAAAPEDSRSAAGEVAAPPASPALLRKAPVPQAILDELWALYSETHMAGVFGGLNEAYAAQGVQAGIVATLLTVLPEQQFREVMMRWEVDAIRLTQLLHVAGVWRAAGEASGTFNAQHPTSNIEQKGPRAKEGLEIKEGN